MSGHEAKPPPGFLGEAGVPHDDYHYVGDLSTSPVSLDYWRSKAREFQSTLNALDSTYQAAVDLLAIPGLSVDQYSQVRSIIDEYESKRFWLKGTAETMNLAAQAINALGGRAPVLSIPATLGLPAIMVPVAYAGAIVAAIAAIEWATGFVTRSYATINSIADLLAVPEPDRATVVIARDKAREALLTVQGSGLSAVASIGKWVALAAVGFFVWRAFRDRG